MEPTRTAVRRRSTGAAIGAAMLTVALVAALPVRPASAASGSSGGTAGVRGEVVSWSTGRPVGGATIRVPEFGMTTTSASDGTFAFPQALAVDAPYRRIRAVVTAPGFGRWTIRGVPLYPNDTLLLHAELRASAYTDRVLTPEERAAGGAPSGTAAAPADVRSYTCTGWDYQLVPPQKIWVFITGDGVSRQYDFHFYVSHVLPNEWISSWDADALGAGAIAVKTYAANRTRTGHAYSSGTNCGDVRDTIDGLFDPSWSTAAATQAVNATFGSILYQNGSLFYSHYFAGSPGEPCAHVTGTYAGWMSQWGTQSCALGGKLWPEIVDVYYDSASTPTSWTYRRNLLLNPSASSAGMYPWHSSGNTTFARKSGTGNDGSWFIHLAPTVTGASATLYEQRPFSGTPSTPYHAQVALRCSLGGTRQCAITLKVIAVPATGKEVVRSRSISVPGDGAWRVYTFDPATPGITHVAARYSVVTTKAVDVDTAVLTAPFGG